MGPNITLRELAIKAQERAKEGEGYRGFRFRRVTLIGSRD